MNTELIKVTPHENLKQSVSARELYLGLGLDKTHWSHWSKTNIEQNEFFALGHEWQHLATEASSTFPPKPKDFAITLEFAKHLAMMAKTGKAHDYRNYFLAIEAKQIPQTKLEWMKLAVQLEEEKEQLKIELDKSKEWYTIKRVADMNNISWKALSWVKLKSASVIVGQPTGKIFDANFSQVNTYSKAAFQLAYPELSL